MRSSSSRALSSMASASRPIEFRTCFFCYGVSSSRTKMGVLPVSFCIVVSGEVGRSELPGETMRGGRERRVNALPARVNAL